MNLKEKTFLNVDELSEYLDASLSTVYKLAQTGEIPAQKMGRQWRFSRERIDQWIASGQGGAFACGDGTPNAEQAPNMSSFRREARGVKNRGVDLSAIFSDEQLKTLRLFSLDSQPRLLTALATAAGRKGLEKLLELSPKVLDEIAMKLVSPM